MSRSPTPAAAAAELGRPCASRAIQNSDQRVAPRRERLGVRIVAARRVVIVARRRAAFHHCSHPITSSAVDVPPGAVQRHSRWTPEQTPRRPSCRRRRPTGPSSGRRGPRRLLRWKAEAAEAPPCWRRRTRCRGRAKGRGRRKITSRQSSWLKIRNGRALVEAMPPCVGGAGSRFGRTLRRGEVDASPGSQTREAGIEAPSVAGDAGGALLRVVPEAGRRRATACRPRRRGRRCRAGLLGEHVDRERAELAVLGVHLRDERHDWS